MPTIGVRTVEGAAKAGLAGIAGLFSGIADFSRLVLSGEEKQLP